MTAQQLLLTLEAGLETVGLFDVDAFDDPESALKSFKPDFYALIMIDIMMPKMSEQLKKIDPDIKVYFLTASDMYYERNRGIEHCALNEDLFLQKRISTNDLIMEVNKKINSTL